MMALLVFIALIASPSFDARVMRKTVLSVTILFAGSLLGTSFKQTFPKLVETR